MENSNFGIGETSVLWQDSQYFELPDTSLLDRIHTIPGPVFSEVQDTVVIGGGITGLSIAMALLERGASVSVIDAGRFGKGVTGANSGHLTCILLDMGYSMVLSNFGLQKTRIIAEYQKKAIDQIEHWVNLYGFDCQFHRLSGYLFAENHHQALLLRDEARAIEKLPLAYEETRQVPLPFAVQQALSFPRQATIQPYSYALSLAHEVLRLGGWMAQETRVINFSRLEGEDIYQIETTNGTVLARNLVLATHTPIGFRPILQSKIEPRRSYIMTFKTESIIRNCIFWDSEENYHYIRRAETLQGPVVLLGGEDHRTGEESDTRQRFNNLLHYAREHFLGVKPIHYWSAQLYDPVDGLPYIGKVMGEPGLYVATGFSGEGLTNGTLAGLVIADAITGQQNPLLEIFDPNRVKPFAAAAGWISENIGTAQHFVIDRIKPIEKEMDVTVGEGKLTEINGERVALYRDEAGELHALSPVCTHAGCLVAWNSAEKTWDCPCHGGRYTPTGDLLEGPPIKPLERISQSQLLAAKQRV